MLGAIPRTVQMLDQGDGILEPCMTDYEEIGFVVHTRLIETGRKWADIDWISYTRVYRRGLNRLLKDPFMLRGPWCRGILLY